MSKETDDKYLNLTQKDSPIWRLKYRPRSLESIKVYRPEIYEQFQGYIKARNIPHLMLVGPKGAGKTVLAEILAREILGEEFEMNYKILFANDPIGKEERKLSKRQSYVSTSMVGSSAGIQKNFRPFIQIRVRPFVSTKKFGNSPFKILVIENFHNLDVEQQAFRRIMEQFSKNCRMILITDKISGIIDPIISRCQLVMVPYISDHLFNRFIMGIGKKEKISVKLNELNYIRHISNQNIGNALDLLQLTQLKNNQVNLENLANMQSEINSKMIKGLITTTLSGNLKAIRRELRSIFKEKKLSKNEIFVGMSKEILQMPIERKVKALFLNMISEADYYSIDNNNEEIQIDKLLYKMALLGKEV